MIKVMLAEDMHMVRGALVALLNLEPDIEVVAEVANGNDIVPTDVKVRPDVAVLDIDLPGKDGLSAVTELHEAVPGSRRRTSPDWPRPATCGARFPPR